MFSNKPITCIIIYYLKDLVRAKLPLHWLAVCANCNYLFSNKTIIKYPVSKTLELLFPSTLIFYIAMLFYPLQSSSYIKVLKSFLHFRVNVSTFLVMSQQAHWLDAR